MTGATTTETSRVEATATTAPATTATDPDALTFVAPCRTLPAGAPLEWLRLAWRDFRAAPRQSLTYGAVVVLLSWALAYVTLRWGGYWELLALVSGFILVAPLVAVGTYSISEQLERGLQPSLRRCFVEERRAGGQRATGGDERQRVGIGRRGSVRSRRGRLDPRGFPGRRSSHAASPESA